MIDVTTSLMLAGEPPVGITRVEGEIARRLLGTAEGDALPVVIRDGRLFALSPDDASRLFARPSTPKRAAEGVRLRLRAQPVAEEPARSPDEPPPPQGLRRRATAVLRRAARGAVARLPDAVREDVRGILIHGRQIARTTLHRGVPPSLAAPPPPPAEPPLRDRVLRSLSVVAHPRDGDVLFTAGLYSNFVPLRAIAELRAATGLRVASVCYDLIRLSWPQFNPRSMGVDQFAADMVALLDASDAVFAISGWTRTELLSFAARVGRAHGAVEVVRLGSDPVPSVTPDLAVADAGILARLAARPFALAVGTVEPRKNLGLLVRVWESLAADPSFDLDLVVVGREGFEAEECASEIEASPLFGRRIHWLDRCPDDALAWLYGRCHLVLCPSFAEGWGLPVSEALRHGRAVIASDRGAHPEAAMGLATLLDPSDDAAWRARIAAAAAAPREDIVALDLPGWDAAVAHIEARLRALLPAKGAAL